MYVYIHIPRLSRWLCGKEYACHCRRCKRCRFDPWVRKIPWRRKWQPTPVFLPGKFHGQRSLAGYSPWSHKESHTAEQLSTHTHIHTHTRIIYTYCVCVCVCVCVCELVKNLPAMRKTWVRPLGWEDILETGKATHSSILAWRIPWTEFHGVAKSSQTRLSDFH